MHNNVVSAISVSAPAMGVAAVRFDFRGAGASTGSHDGGPGERDDLRAALDFCAAESDSLPLAIAGYSFGAEVALTVDHPDQLAGSSSRRYSACSLLTRWWRPPTLGRSDWS